MDTRSVRSGVSSLQPRSLAGLFALSAAIALLCVISAAGDGLDKVTVSGWPKITKKWPTPGLKYFVAVEKGHHFVRVVLPQNFDGDLRVKLNYFYNYERVRPFVQIVPCNKNEDVLLNEQSQPKGSWLRHEQIVKGSDCARRNELAYNILLHDAGDVFAWSFFEITGVQNGSEVVTYSTTTSATSSAPTTSTTPATSTTPTTTERPDESPSESSPTTKPWITDSTYEVGESSGGNEAKPTDKSPVVAPTQAEPSENEPTTSERSPSRPSSPPAPEVKPISTANSTDREVGPGELTEAPNTVDDSPVDVRDDSPVDEKKTIGPQDQRAVDPTDKPDELQKLPHPDEPSDAYLSGPPTAAPSKPSTRRKREVERNIDMRCDTTTCDRHQFEMARFYATNKGIPALSSFELNQGYEHFLNTKDQPFAIHIESSDESFADVDTCVHLSLFMDPGTSFKLLLKDNNPGVERNLLEVVERKAADSGASKWEPFNRCVSDYMPRYKPSGSNQHELDFILEPGKSPVGERVGIKLDPKRSVTLRAPRPSMSFLPNVLSLASASEMENFWLLDRDGVKKPSVSFETSGAEASSNTSSGPVRKLHIADIDPGQDHFDLTSRWLKVNEIEIAENPVLFWYKADKNPALKSVVFEFQRAGWPLESWISQTEYLDDSNLTAPSNISAEVGASSRGRQQQHVFPIRLRGLDSEEFRLRVRHDFKRADQSAGETTHDLRIAALSFADACADENFCRARGECVPTGTATADCACRQGYSGRHCERVRPCDVLYNNQTGRELCSSAGATCVDNLPVLRCKWPNDQFYQCRELFRADGAEIVPLPPDQELESDDQVSRLKERASKQARLIIILSVFMVSSVLFTIVLIVNLITRLHKSKRNLERTQNEMLELTRRSFPSTSGAPFGRPATGRMKPPAGISYNNQAFDVE